MYTHVLSDHNSTDRQQLHPSQWPGSWFEKQVLALRRRVNQYRNNASKQILGQQQLSWIHNLTESYAHGNRNSAYHGTINIGDGGGSGGKSKLKGRTTWQLYGQQQVMQIANPTDWRTAAITMPPFKNNDEHEANDRPGERQTPRSRLAPQQRQQQQQEWQQALAAVTQWPWTKDEKNIFTVHATALCLLLQLLPLLPLHVLLLCLVAEHQARQY